MSVDWQGLPDEQRVCAPDSPIFAARVDNDEFVFITHSLGSRITTDALQRLARFVEEESKGDSRLEGVSRSFKNRGAKVFMLTNQLPLLESGLEPASVRDAVPAYCRPDGAHYADRLFKETELIAFSDPNDLLSYPIPDAFVRERVDSRLYLKQVNITINIAPVTNLLGVGESANPLAAQVDYDDGERVIGLITRGIGQPETAPVVNDRCTWLEVAEDLR